MNQTPIKDVLSWDQFFNETLKEDSYPPKKIKLFNRLMAHSNNFFIISAIGGFTPGYLMLISKKLVPSLSFIEDEYLNELKWLTETMRDVVKKSYDRNTVIFEHGMCACVGGLDRAHMHLMTIDKNASENLIKDSINNVLIKRKAGITSVEMNGHKLENIHDILEITNAADDDKPHPMGILPPTTIFPPPCIPCSDLRTFITVDTKLIQGSCILVVMSGDNSEDCL